MQSKISINTIQITHWTCEAYKMIEDEENRSVDVLSIEEEDVLIYSWTQDAILNRQLLTLLPLIYEYFSFIGAESIKSR